jgi:hypothetical protein
MIVVLYYTNALGSWAYYLYGPVDLKATGCET